MSEPWLVLPQLATAITKTFADAVGGCRADTEILPNFNKPGNAKRLQPTVIHYWLSKGVQPKPGTDKNLVHQDN